MLRIISLAKFVDFENGKIWKSLYCMYYTFRIIVSMKFSEKDEAGFRRVSSDYYKTTFWIISSFRWNS